MQIIKRFLKAMRTRLFGARQHAVAGDDIGAVMSDEAARQLGASCHRVVWPVRSAQLPPRRNPSAPASTSAAPRRNHVDPSATALAGRASPEPSPTSHASMGIDVQSAIALATICTIDGASADEGSFGHHAAPALSGGGGSFDGGGASADWGSSSSSGCDAGSSSD